MLKTKRPGLSPYWSWELALTRYYLGTRGSEGSSALEFVDAQPRRLAEAIGLPPSDGDAARTSFLGVFRRDGLVDAFGHGWSVRPPDSLPVMGYFNYLVLSCYVASVAPEVAQSGLFPERLREILGWDQGISSLEGLATLWKNAAVWCDGARAAGRDVRPIALPDPGWMKRIGHSIRIAFPSRHDLDRMGRSFSSLAAVPALDSHRLSDAVRAEIGRQRWSQGFIRAFEDFDRRRARGERLLADHAFWLAMAALRPPVERDDAGRRFELDVSTDADGLDAFVLTTDAEDVLMALDVSIDERPGSPVSVDLTLDQVLELFRGRSASLPPDLLRCHSEGFVPFVEVEWGVWRAARHIEGPSVRPLVRRRERPVGASAADRNACWRLHPVMSVSEAARLAVGTGRRDPLHATDVSRVRVVGGIRVGDAYLGRSGFLPTVEAVSGCDASIVTVQSTTGAPTVRVVAGRVELECAEPIEGVWRIPIEEAGSVRSSPALAFQRDAPERVPKTADSLAPGWRIAEPVPDGLTPTTITGNATDLVEASTERRLCDLLEVLVAAGRRGWDEAGLHRVLSVVAPIKRATWDLLRLLVDGGWLEGRVCPVWRARRWFLVPPRLVSFADGRTFALEGAAGGRMRDRFHETARRQCGSSGIQEGGAGWRVPLPVAEVADGVGFVRGMGLPVVQPETEVPPADGRPSFPPSLYSDEFRSTASVWSWSSGRFVGPVGGGGGAVVLSRLTTPRPNAADIYRIDTGDAPPLLLDGRSAALIVAHSMAGRALFRFDATLGAFDRLAHDGGLPPIVARHLRLRTLRAPEMVFGVDGSWIYRTPCSPADAGMLSGWLGPAFEGPSSDGDRGTGLREMAMARARGARSELLARSIWKAPRTC
ncbi:hypothetical protein [Aureimonas jatrophae]|uniref:Uncharacterized protein n=1 Tax=Aureimonas jatrophae TaxID=1166073 RepID=A0A1H0M3A9_9HYPH|nr:hypothetical protein [Aureimonas jatrophae]MBB3952649.1 hypothetical protein [Aureimonas jatrophae]SDO74660.1 hypothetical protein SAMN05192530_11243 [Aureimonas jatrophae]